MRRAVVLFTRDLRVRDQPALAAAVREAQEIVPAFVLDSRLLAGTCGSPNRLAFLLDCLHDLDRELSERGGRLILRRGDVVREAIALAERTAAEAIFISDDVTPYARERAQLLARACRAQRIELRLLPGVTILAAGEITPAGGDHYRVFTPYWRAWSEADPGRPLAAPRRIAMAGGVAARPIPTLSSLTRARPSAALARGGESEARRVLERWLRGGLARYRAGRDELADAGSSRLSAHLHFGSVSARAVLQRTRAAQAGGEFERQLCWRDFHHQVLAARPEMPSADYRPRGDRWREDPGGLAAWRRGETGYPIVDAGMRQLAAEGFMPNRARLIAASFLTKSLYLDWRAGAAHFARLLLDADVANNVGNWQWVAGTGNDTRPNRVLNPLRQALRFDPGGDYVRRYVPELAGLAGAAIHTPWRLPPAARRRIGYPAPLLDPQAEPLSRAARGGRARA